MDKKEQFLPPRPGEKPVNKEIKEVPFAVYINGNLTEMSKVEAMGVMSQIVNILLYLETSDKNEVEINKIG